MSTYEQQEAEAWRTFLAEATLKFGSSWWYTWEAIDKVGRLPLQVQRARTRNGARRSLGKLLGARRGWNGELHLESRGDPNDALEWRLLLLDQVLDDDGVSSQAWPQRSSPTASSRS